MKSIAYNIFQSTLEFFRKFSYICAPILGVLIFLLVYHFGFYRIKDEQVYISNLINVSGALAGFELTSLSILLVLPENKFTSLLKRNKRLHPVYLENGVSLFLLLIAMLIGFSNISVLATTIIFIAGISNTLVSAYSLIRISYYSNKSK